jgi:hypothetical protein
MYRGFNDIYEQHVQNAKFDAVKGAEFKSLKERLISVCHLLKKHPDLSPGKRMTLFQAFLTEDDIRLARQVLPKKDKNKEAGKTSWLSFSLSKIVGLFSWSKGTDEESFGKEVKNLTSDTSDSDFLVQLMRIDDKDLEVPIRRVVDVACTQLSSSIDAAVKKMTHTVLQMQQEECKGSIKREIKAEEMKAHHDMLVKFIRDVNKISAKRETS